MEDGSRRRRRSWNWLRLVDSATSHSGSSQFNFYYDKLVCLPTVLCFADLCGNKRAAFYALIQSRFNRYTSVGKCPALHCAYHCAYHCAHSVVFSAAFAYKCCWQPTTAAATLGATVANELSDASREMCIGATLGMGDWEWDWYGDLDADYVFQSGR